MRGVGRRRAGLGSALGIVALVAIGCSSAVRQEAVEAPAVARTTPGTSAPLPRCGGDAGTEAPPAHTTLTAPVGDPTCLATVWWNPHAGILSVPVAVDPSATPTRRRFALGSAGDEVVLGDWDCDGLATPAVYRPATGGVHLFAAWPTDAVPEPAVRVDSSGIIDGTATVASSAPGTSCQEVRISP